MPKRKLRMLITCYCAVLTYDESENDCSDLDDSLVDGAWHSHLTCDEELVKMKKKTMKSH